MKSRSGLVGLLVILMLSGCEAEGVHPPTTGTVRGQTIKGEDGTGYGPVTVALLEIETLTFFQHVETDDQGGFLFEHVPPASYVPVVYDNARELFHLNQASYAVEAGGTLELRLELVPNSGALADLGLMLRGEVTDAVTGEPIENATAETTHFGEGSDTLFSEIHGRSDTVTQLTGPDGRFTLWPLAVLVNVPEETGFVPHVRIYKAGYKSAYAGGWREIELPPFLHVALEPGQDSGVVTGELRTLAGDPVPNLGVALEWRRAAGALKDDSLPGKLLLPNLVAWSDAEGRFRIEGVPEGGFLLDPSFMRDDGWAGQQGVQVDVSASQPVADAGTLIVAPALAPDFPADSAQLTMEQVRFDWQPVEGAVLYEIDVRRMVDDRGLSRTTEDPYLQPEAGLFAVASRYTWVVSAFMSLSPIIEVSRFERPVEFTVIEGAKTDTMTAWH